MREYILKYRRPAENFNEALPIGNGSLGAMVYGRYPVEKLTVNQDTLWTGKPHRCLREGAYEAYRDALAMMDAGRVAEAETCIEERFTGPFTDAYLPLGTLTYAFEPGSVRRYARSLHMDAGVARTACEGFVFEHLASAPFHCIASSLRFAQPTAVTIGFSSELACTRTGRGSVLTVRGACPMKVRKKVPIYPEGEEGVRFAAVLTVDTDGEARVRGGAVSVKNATRIEVFFTTETSFVSHNDIAGTGYAARAYKRATAARKAGYAAIAAAQREYYRRHFGQVELSLSNSAAKRKTTDKRLFTGRDAGLVELLFHYGRYLTIAASAKGSQATTLQGIWNEKISPIWKSNYTVNINTEMNYWPTLPCGLTDFYAPLVDLVKKIADTGADTARHYYHADGFVCHHNIDLWGNTIAVGGEGKEYIPGNAVFSYWNGASGWLCRGLFEYYEYTLDKNYLRKTAYPLMKAAAKFYQSILRPADGKLVISPATSPENQYMLDGRPHCFGRWTTMMQSIVEDLFRSCVRACEILRCDAAWKAELEKIIPRLRVFAVDGDGTLLEWDRSMQERDPRHRHVSHLYGLYPAELISAEKTPELAQACRKTLEKRGDEGTGWSIAWKACLWAKLGEGDHALKLIRRQLQPVESTQTDCAYESGGTYPNLFCAHPPFQIDGNFGAAAAVAMLLLQCGDGEIKILPALPGDLPRGFVRGLAAKGNIRVDIVWNDRAAERVTLVSPITQTITLSVNGEKRRVELKANKKYLYRKA